MEYLTITKLSECFRVLNVNPGDTWDRVRKSYYLLAKQYHPDLHPSNLAHENKLKEINQSFQVLEKHYKDQEKTRELSSVSTLPDHPESPEPVFMDVQYPASGDKNNRWNQWVQRLQENWNRYEKKVFLLDINKTIRIHSHTAEHGGIVRLRKGNDTFQVKIPSGSWNRMSLRIPERGEASLFGKKRGDLLLNIQVEQLEEIDPGESRFFYEIQVPREKVLSAKVLTLDSVHGPIKFFLPRSTRDGQKIMLKYQAKDKAPSSHVVKVHFT